MTTEGVQLVKLNNVLTQINKMNRYDDLMAVLDTATIQWNKLFPDQEVMTISVPRDDPEEKKRIIKLVLKYIDDEVKEKASKPLLVLCPKKY